MRWLALISSLLVAACVAERIPLEEGPGSFVVHASLVDPVTWPAGCQNTPEFGTPACRHPFPIAANPIRVRIQATVLDRRAQAIPDFAETVLVDVRPGEFIGGDPAGELLQFVGGTAEAELEIAHAFGKVHIWVEDCGSSSEPGSFATGVSEAFYFDLPRIHQINETEDNTTSPMGPRAANVCAISGDPRYGFGTDLDGNPAFVGYSHGRTVNAPPPAMGTFLDIQGCTRAEWDGGTCDRGMLVVTSIGNEGFYFTDVQPSGQTCADDAECPGKQTCDLGNGLCICDADTPCPGNQYCDTARSVCMPGFNHMYAFTFNYPDDLEVGDVLTLLRGSPVEFAGSTQLSNPIWLRDGVRRGHDLIPQPVKVDPDKYAGSTRSFGRNDSDVLDLEKLEGALVCFDNLAPSSRLVPCDVNASGNIERQGCGIGFGAPLPPRCDDGIGTSPAPPSCDERSVRPFCLPLTEQELEICELSTYVPNNPAEYCCERVCYHDLTCTEESSYIGFGQWVADVYGRYEPDDAPPVKLAIISRDADPDGSKTAINILDPVTREVVDTVNANPLEWGAHQRTLLEPPKGEEPEPHERQRLRVIGNLRQVLAARPVWVLIARSPADIEPGATCP